VAEVERNGSVVEDLEQRSVRDVFHQDAQVRTAAR
jgi:hypothetical protein